MSASSAHAMAQLRRALDAGAIDQQTFETACAALQASANAQANAQAGAQAGAHSSVHGDGQAVSAGSVGIAGDNSGTINLGVWIQQGTRPGAPLADLRRAYLARVLSQADQLPLFLGDAAQGRIRLSAVYTASRTSRLSDATDAETGATSAVRRRSGSTPDEVGEHWSALEVLDAERHLVLLGGPGSGKSTFVQFVAMAMAGELLALPSAGPNLATLTAPLPAEDAAAEPAPVQRWRHGALLPVLVTLRDLASQLPPPGTATNAQTVWDFIRGRLEQAALGDFAPHLRDILLQQGGLILLDGLDEVPDALSRRTQIQMAVQDFAASFARCRFLVTSRTYAYQRQDWKLADFVEVELLPFSDAQMHAFVDAWYGHMVALERLTAADARDRAGILQRAVERNERLQALAARPLLLTLIAQLQTEGGGSLPDKREALYDKAVEMLLDRWERMKVRVNPRGEKEIEPSLAEWLNTDRDAIRRQLNRLAFEAHRDQPLLSGSADLRQEALIAALLRASEQQTDLNLRLLECYLRDRAGLLSAHGEGLYQFPHRSFQEYLAACHLTDAGFPEQLAELARSDPNRWREVTLLAAAKAARGAALNAWALAETLCPAAASAAPAPGAVEDHWGALLAGQVLVETVDLTEVAPRDQPKCARVRDWQCTLLRGGALPATERALAGRTLAQMGDPRREIMHLDEMQFCWVPPGAFCMGDEANAQTRPQHTVPLSRAYGIGRFPVSTAQWREAWQGRPEGDAADTARNAAVTGISWDDAQAFCQTLNARWHDRLPPGMVVDLPSEAEWEKAARGGLSIPIQPVVLPQAALRTLLPSAAAPERANPAADRTYPWGPAFAAERANVGHIISGPGVLGMWPAGSSPYGCEEMSGGIWEWTRSLWGSRFQTPQIPYPYDPEDGRREDPAAPDQVLRVLRGGSWIDGRRAARCAARYRIHPQHRYGDVGFRLVLRWSAVP